MGRRLGCILLSAVLTALPGTAYAIGDPKAEPNWKLWVVGTVAGLLLAFALATGLVRWWLGRMHAGTAKLFGVLAMLLLAALFSGLVYLQFVGPILDLVFYPALAVVAIVLIASLAVNRKPVR